MKTCWLATALLARGADVNAETQNGTALLQAAEKGYTAVAEVLLAHGADMEAKSPLFQDQGGLSPLHAAVFQGHAQMVRLLLQHGANINALCIGFVQRNRQVAGTPLHFAVQRPNLELVELLLANHADPKRWFGVTLRLFPLLT